MLAFYAESAIKLQPTNQHVSWWYCVHIICNFWWVLVLVTNSARMSR